MTAKNLKFFLAAALLPMVVGCSMASAVWKPSASSAVAPLAAISTPVGISPAWTANVGEVRAATLFPAVTDKFVYAASARGAVSKFDKVTGRQLWRLETGQSLSGGVAANDLMVVVGTEDGVLLAHDLEGNLMWKVPLKSELNGPPVIGDGMVVVRTLDGHIYGLDAPSGAQRWDYQYDQPSLVLRSRAGLTIYRGAVFAGLPQGKLVALRTLDGTTGWEAQVSLTRGATEVERINDVIGAPAVDDNAACAATYQGRVACFDLTSGTPLWARPFASSASIAQDLKNIYLTDLEGGVHAFDKASGAHIWQQPALQKRQTTAPQVASGRVMVGDGQGYLHVLTSEDGQMIGRQLLDGSAILGQPVVAGKRVYLQTRNGQLSAQLLH